MPIPLLSRGTLFVLIVCATGNSLFGQGRSLSSLMPDTTLAYLESAPAGHWLDHPLRNDLLRSDPFKKIWSSPDVMKVRGGMTLAEIALGDSVENIARKLTEGGLAIAFDRKHEGLVLLARTKDHDWLDEYLTKLVTMLRDDADGKGGDDPVKQADYRGQTVYKFRSIFVTALDDILLITNKPELGKSVVDAFQSDDKLSANGLDKSEGFQRVAESWRRTDGGALELSGEVAWGYIDVAMLRDEGLAKNLFGSTAKSFPAELVLGGLLAELQHTPVVTASLSLLDQSINLEIRAPHEAEWGGEERQYFYGENGTGQSLPILAVENSLASLSTYRDLSLLWLRAGDLFDERVNDQLAQADSTLTTLFSGRDFGTEILGALKPELRVVVARQEFAADQPTPAIRLPSFALVGQLREPDLMQGELKRIFQSLVGFLNIVGAMEGRPQLDLGMETEGDNQFVSASYVREVDRPLGDAAPIQFNFGPSIAFVDESVIISSTLPLAKKIAKQLQDPTAKATTPSNSGSVDLPTGVEPVTNTILEIYGDTLYQVLVDNREQLVAQNMLEEGRSNSEAAAEIQTLLSIVTLFEEASMQLRFDSRTVLAVELKLESRQVGEE